MNLSIGQRIGLGFALLFLFVLVGGGVGLAFAGRNFLTVVNTQENVAQIEDVAELERLWSQTTGTVDRMLLTRQTSLIEQQLVPQLAAFNGQLEVLQEARAHYSDDALLRHDQFFGQIDALAAELNNVVGQITVAVEDGRWARAQTLRHTELAAFERRFDAQLTGLIDQIEGDVGAAVVQSREAVSIIRVAWIVLAFFSLVTALALAILVSRSVLNPVNQLITGANRLAAGAFDERVPLGRQDEIGQLAIAFNQMAEQVQFSYGQLEERVRERTQALETSLQVSRRLSTIVEPSTLVTEVVDQIQYAFGYYHVHIYLLDESGRFLEMVGGTGEPGRIMLAEGHRIPVGKGLVGRAAQTKQVNLVADVSQNPDWLPNPLLPETKAEVAVPIVFRGDAFGVLDVQENEIEELGEEDVELLQAIANQVAIALQNARLLVRARQQAEQAATLNVIGQKIQRATAVEEVLEVAARELASSLGVERTSVRLVNPRKIVQKQNGNPDK